MKRSVTVCLGEGAIETGTLTFEAQGARRLASFVYANTWLAHPARFALSPDLPLVSGHQYRANQDAAQSAFFGCLADAEPDGWGRMVIARAHARQPAAQRKPATAGRPPLVPLNEVDYLLWVSDFCRAGALRLRDAQGIFQRPEDGGRGTPPLIALPDLLTASRAIEENRETARDLATLRGVGTSLGGLRPKCSIIDADGSLAIGKFPSVSDTRSIVYGEVLALKLAAKAGINAARARVVDSQGVPVAVITRFDRVTDGTDGRPGRRLMYLSARSLLQAAPAEQHSYVDIANAIRMHSSQAALDLAELWRRMVFNVLINNVDDHLNNHGFLHHAHGQWKLAPAFDLNPFPDKERALKTWISEDSGDAASLAEALHAAPLFGLSARAAQSVLHEVKTAVSRWKEVARSIAMTARECARFAPAFAHPEL